MAWALVREKAEWIIVLEQVPDAIKKYVKEAFPIYPPFPCLFSTTQPGETYTFIHLDRSYHWYNPSFKDTDLGKLIDEVIVSGSEETINELGDKLAKEIRSWDSK